MTTIEHSSDQPEISPLFFREKRKPGTVDAPDVDTVDKTGTEDEKALLCAQCRAVITSHQHAVAVNGDHLHAFFNPAGIIYEIRCFNQAKGCTVHGHPTVEFSWFTGYTWRYALCINCLAHLGWLFESGGNTFFGLIQGKLIDA